MPENQEAPPVLYQYCVDAYNLMLNAAKLESIEQDDGTVAQKVVWEGMLTALITQKMALSIPYFTFVTRALKRMDCIKQLRRGGGTAPSRWEMLREPTYELFEETKSRETVQSPTRRTSATNAVLEQMAAMNVRVLRLEKILENIIKEEGTRV